MQLLDFVVEVFVNSCGNHKLKLNSKQIKISLETTTSFQEILREIRCSDSEF